MKTPLFGSVITGVTSPSVSNYWFPTHTFSETTSSTTESSRSLPFPNTFTLSRLNITVQTAPGGATSWDFTVMKNGVASALTVHIAGSSTTGSDTTHTVTFNAGDTISIQSTPNSTPNSPGNWYFNYIADAGDANSYGVIFGSNVSLPSISATNYTQVFGGNSIAWDTTESNVENLIATGGTLTNLNVKLSTAPGTSKSYAISLNKNGTNSSLSTTISGASTTGNDTSDTLSISAGDSISIQSTPTGTPSQPQVGWSMQWNPTNNGETPVGYGNSVVPSASATNFDQILGGGRGSYNTTESLRLTVPFDSAILTAIYIKLGTAPGSGNSRTFTIRDNSANTSAAVTVSNAATTGSSTGLDVGITQGQTVDLQSSISGTPATLTGGVHMGLLLYIPPIVTQTSRSRIQINATQTQTSMSRIQNTSLTATSPSKSRVQTSPTTTQLSKSRIAINGSQTITSKSRVQNTEAQAQISLSRIQNTESVTQPSKSRIQISPTATTTLKSRLSVNGAAVQTSKSRVQATETQTQSSRSRIQTSPTTTQLSKSRIAVNTQQTTTEKSRISTASTATQSEKSRIQSTLTQTNPSISRIQANVTSTRPSKSRIQINGSATQSEKSRVQSARTATQSSKSNIGVTHTTTQLSKSRTHNYYGSNYASVILADGPQAWYRLGENSGTVAMDEIAAADGAYVSSPSLGQTGLVTFDPNKAVSFNGSTQYMTVPVTPNLSAFSIEFLFKPTSISTASRIIDWQDSGPNHGFRIEQTGSTISFTVSGSGSATAAFPAVNGMRYHVVATFDGSKARLYINGLLFATSGSTTSMTTAAQTMMFMRRSNATGSFTAGTLDEVSLWSSALNQTQVTSHYNAALSTQAQTSLSRMQAGVTRTQTSKSRIQISSSVTQTSKSTVVHVYSVTQSSRSRISNATEHTTQTSKSRILITLPVSSVGANDALGSFYLGQLYLAQGMARVILSNPIFLDQSNDAIYLNQNNTGTTIGQDNSSETIYL